MKGMLVAGWFLVGLVVALVPMLLFIYRWGEWDFQPSWMAASVYFSNLYIPLFTGGSVLVLAWQIRVKARAEKLASLMQMFERQVTELLKLDPGNPDELDTELFNLPVKYLSQATSFIKSHSRFNHALMGVSNTLADIKPFDEKLAQRLRAELFVMYTRASISKYEKVIMECVAPQGYQPICDENAGVKRL